MKISKYTAIENTNEKSVKRYVSFETRIHEKGEKELIVQIKDNGELNETLSCLIDDIFDIKKLAKVLNDCIGRK